MDPLKTIKPLKKIDKIIFVHENIEHMEFPWSSVEHYRERLSYNEIWDSGENSVVRQFHDVDIEIVTDDAEPFFADVTQIVLLGEKGETVRHVHVAWHDHHDVNFNSRHKEEVVDGYFNQKKVFYHRMTNDPEHMPFH